MTRSISEQITELENAIASLEAQRDKVGDDVVDLALASMREKLALLHAQMAAPDQERRQITVLYAGITRLDTFLRRRTSEELDEVVRDVAQQVDEVVRRFGGLIDRRHGDTFRALWGVRQTRENDPEQAIHAALAMLAEVAALARKYGAAFTLRIGINTGPVLLDRSARASSEPVAAGNTVNLASLLEDTAAPGEIIISHNCYRHVRGIFDVLSRTPVSVKGRTKLIPTYVVQNAKPSAYRLPLRGVEGIETRMIGRVEELEQLKALYREATDTASARYVTVVGDPGVGKSRLLHEFEHWIELLPDKIYYLKGRSLAARRDVPYSLLRDIFAYRFKIHEQDKRGTVLTKFREGMAPIVSPERADLVGHLIGFDFSVSPAVRRMLGSPHFNQVATGYLIQYFRRLASEPTVLFLEDLHWADDSSLGFLNHMMTELTAAEILVVGLARHELFERRGSWGAHHDNHTRIDLAPLSERACRDLVSEILYKLDVIPNYLADLIVEGSAGNPYYVEELIKMLLEEGVILHGEEQWQVAQVRPGDVRVPPTLTSVLQARVDDLPPAERVVLQRASVVGRLFWLDLIQELAADVVERGHCHGALSSLIDRELIYRREHSLIDGTAEYLFKNSILRDVVYDAIPPADQAQLHGRIARWLEANSGERVAEHRSLIANHYRLAHEPQRAGRYLRRAGEHLLSVGAQREAIGAFEQALALLPDEQVAERATLLLNLGETYNKLSDYTWAAQHLESGLRLADSIDDAALQVRALNELGLAAMDQQGDYAAAGEAFEKALDLARDHGLRAGEALALRRLGSLAYQAGDTATMNRRLEECLAIYDELNDLQGRAHALNALGVASDVPEARQAHFENSLAMFRKIGDRRGEAMCLSNLGYVALQQGRLDEVERFFMESLAIDTEIGWRLGIAYDLQNLGEYYAARGAPARAWEYVGRALQQVTAVEAIPLTLHILTVVTDLHIQAGRYVPAAEMAGLIAGHPAVTEEDRQALVEVVRRLEEIIPEEQLAEAMDEGRHQRLDDVVAALLRELSDLPTRNMERPHIVEGTDLFA